jgi:uncharacterized protein (TIGR02246 family)
MTEVLAARLKLVEDDLAVRRLVNRYLAVADKLDWRAWSELFAEDGTFVLPGTTEALTGRREIFEVIDKRLGGAFHATQHYITNLEVEVEGDSATAEGDLIFAAVTDGGDPSQYLLMGGRYFWSFVRSVDGWEVQRAGNSFVWSDPSQTVGPAN